MAEQLQLAREPWAPYGRHSRREPTPPVQSDGARQPYRGETYYQHPALKPGHYKWLIVFYFFVGGLAGAAQLLAMIADLRGRREDRVIVRHGRWFALAGAIASPLLLIADLLKPQRFYNMLRIFRRTSPMSIGAWGLAGFGAFSGLTAAAQVVEDRGHVRAGRALGRIFSLPASLLGSFMAYYTGTLLAGTSVPLWASVPRHLPALFGVSGGATAASALALTTQAAGAPKQVTERLERVEMMATAAECAALAATYRQWRRQGVDAPLYQPSIAPVMLGVLGAGLAVPLAIHSYQKLTGRQSRRASNVAAGAALLGGVLLRAAVIFGGRKSAQSPQDYFHFAQPPAEPASDMVWGM